MAGKRAITRRLRLFGEIIKIGKTSVLVKAYSVPNLAAKVYDGKGREIGYVSNVFGPVSSPFVSLKVLDRDEVEEGEAVYIEKT